MATATCGWCKTKDLTKQHNRSTGQGLETHNVPNSRTTCNGQATSPYYATRKKGNHSMFNGNGGN